MSDATQPTAESLPDVQEGQPAVGLDDVLRLQAEATGGARMPAGCNEHGRRDLDELPARHGVQQPAAVSTGGVIPNHPRSFKAMKTNLPYGLTPELLALTSHIQEAVDHYCPGHEHGKVVFSVPPGVHIGLQIAKHLPRPHELEAALPQMLMLGAQRRLDQDNRLQLEAELDRKRIATEKERLGLL